MIKSFTPYIYFFCFHHLSELFFSEFFMAVPSAALWQKNFYPDQFHSYSVGICEKANSSG